MITGSTYDVRSTEILENLKWITIDKHLRNREITMTFKALTRKLPNYLVMVFTKCDNENYNLRSNNVKLSLPKPKTHFLKNQNHGKITERTSQ